MSLLIAPRVHDIGFSVRRLLPSRACQRVGPFIFVDHMGPARFEKHSTAGDVRQHPHIGLATVTYLFTGAMMHRDSLGSLQRIEPGAINLMTAGRGIVHSERIPEDVREAQEAVQGIQTWLALPLEDEQIAPMFEHYPADAIPGSQVNGGQLRVLIGRLEGLESPVKTCSTTTYLELQLDPEGVFELTLAGQELAVYLVQGGVQVNGEHVPEHHLLVAGSYPNTRYLRRRCCSPCLRRIKKVEFRKASSKSSVLLPLSMIILFVFSRSRHLPRMTLPSVDLRYSLPSLKKCKTVLWKLSSSRNSSQGLPPCCE